MNIEEAIDRALESVLDEKIYISFLRDLKESEKILFFADNCGKVVFDRLSFVFLDKKIKFVVKDKPTINDATIYGAIEAGLKGAKNTEIVEMGTGKNVELIKEEKLQMIISKGQGNYGTLSEQKGVCFLLIAKCPIIAQDLGASIGSTIFRKK